MHWRLNPRPQSGIAGEDLPRISDRYSSETRSAIRGRHWSAPIRRSLSDHPMVPATLACRGQLPGGARYLRMETQQSPQIVQCTPAWVRMTETPGVHSCIRLMPSAQLCHLILPTYHSLTYPLVNGPNFTCSQQYLMPQVWPLTRLISLSGRISRTAHGWRSPLPLALPEASARRCLHPPGLIQRRCRSRNRCRSSPA